MTDNNHTPPPFGMWMGVLGGGDKPSKKQDATDYPAHIKQRLIYVLEPKKGHQVILKFFTTRVLKDGTYGKLTAYNPGNVLNYAPAKFILSTDVRILKHVAEDMLVFPHDGYPLKHEEGLKLLRRVVATERCYWVNKNSASLKLGGKRNAVWEWEQDEQGTQLLSLDTGSSNIHLIPTSPPWYVDVKQSVCGRVDSGQPPEIADILLNLPPLPAGYGKDVLDRVLGLLPKGVPHPIVLDCGYQEVKPKAVLQLQSIAYNTPGKTDETWAHVAELWFDYDGVLIPHSAAKSDTVRRAVHGTVVDFLRDKTLEASVLALLGEHGLSKVAEDLRLDASLSAYAFALDGNDWPSWMLYQLPQLEEQGVRVDVVHDFHFQVEEAERWEMNADYDGLMGRPQLSVMLKTGAEVDLIDALGRWVAENPDVLREDKLAALREQETIPVALPGLGFLPVPGVMVANILHYMLDIFASETPEEAMVSAPQILSLQESMQESGDIAITVKTGDWMQRMQQLQHADAIPEVSVPKALNAKLRDYQHDGLGWMQFLREMNLNGILADDMGLGKTVQTIAHILKEKELGHMDRPVLVVAPTSLMHNWQRELNSFAPELSVLVSHGSDRAQFFDSLDHYDVVLTTYPLIVRDAEFVLALNYHILILDEAQYIKNVRSKAAQTVRLIDARHRLCLTGTPMENHLGELWAQFDFLMPGYLYDQNQFADWFRKPIENMGDQARQQVLSTRVRPFLLRRTKEQVAAELPPKTEIIRSIDMESDQRELYDSVRLAMQKRVRDALDSMGADKSRIVVLDALLKMRQVCCDPRLLASQQDEDKPAVSSAKISMLRDMIPEMVDEGRRILLFSQFAGMLRLIEQEMNDMGIPYVILTGQTKDRMTPVDKFQQGEVPVFLISLKAGGVGLNLTAADTVIHFDPWWNPAAESQATDRAHRIGQDKPVFVYKMVIEGSVEEKILDMQQRKKELMQGVLGEKGGKDTPLWSTEEMEQLFAPIRE